MISTAWRFPENAREALLDPGLRLALERARAGFVGNRQAAVHALPEFEALRQAARELKEHTLTHLDWYLERFEAEVTRRGGYVHWAETPEEGCRIILDICRRAEARAVTKGKSMVGEEMAINEALEGAGLEVIETDLGEYIIQLAHEPPSHIIAPAIHKTREQIAELFNPRVHVVTAGIEKVIPTLEDMSTVLRLLARSATGQEMSTYTTLSTGPRRPGDLDGPDELHVVLLDNGRSEWLRGDFHEMLRCIRCGACLNHCPVYNAIGGHAYGWVYSGPMGSVLTPLIRGLDEAAHLPNACTLNGRCQQVCPMSIPLPDMLRRLRARAWEQHLIPKPSRLALAAWREAAKRPRLYNALARGAIRVLGWLGRGRGRFRRLPLAGGWTRARDLPAPEGETFQAAWARLRGAPAGPAARGASAPGGTGGERGGQPPGDRNGGPPPIPPGGSGAGREDEGGRSS